MYTGLRWSNKIIERKSKGGNLQGEKIERNHLPFFAPACFLPHAPPLRLVLYSWGNKCQLMAKSRLRVGTELAAFVRKLLSNMTSPSF